MLLDTKFGATVVYIIISYLHQNPSEHPKQSKKARVESAALKLPERL